MFSQNRVLNRFLALLFSVFVTGNIIVLSSFAQSDDIDVRIRRQMRHINNGEQERTLSPKQAKQLKDTLNVIALQVESARKRDKGKLAESQITKFDNDLNQNFNSIQSQLVANKKVKVKGNVLGPNWATGTDGAQDPKMLRRQMKVQEQRQLKQYGQAMQQVQEMQQQQYEQDMLKTLGKQRPQILKNKQQIEKFGKKPVPTR